MKKLFLFFRKQKQRLNSSIKRQLRRVGIFKRLTLSFLLLLLALAFFLTFFSFRQYSTEINLNIERYVTLLVQNVELKISDTMKEYEDIALAFYNDSEVLEALAENTALEQEYPDVQSLPEDSLRQYTENTYLIENKLYSMWGSQKYIINIQFVSPNRQYHMVEAGGFQRGGTIRDLKSFYESEYYLLPQEKNGYPVWIDSASQTDTFYKNEQNVYGLGNIVTLETAVYEPVSRSFLGVLLMNIDLNTFSEDLESYESYNQGNTFLVGADGVLAWFRPSLLAPSFPRDDALFSGMLDKNQGVTRLEADGRKVLLAYERIPGTEMFAAHLADLDVLLNDTYRIRNLCILALAFAVIACFIISYYVTVSISSPIRQLIHVMNKTGDGKWNVRYENSGHDEITILGDHFNEMAEKTNQLIDQIYLSEIRRQKALVSWKNAQLEAMFMQINPHFLYNTLDIIRWEAMYEANGESPVTRMIETFSRLCRMGMRTSGNTIPLKEGLLHASTYLEVINFRHSDKIELVIDTQADADAFYIPQFMLQPIMENAVVHAFGDASRGYSIRIHSFTENNSLHILVADNGKGMTGEELAALEASMKPENFSSSDTGKGVGLQNVQQRIQLFYGNTYGLHITSSVGNGTQIEIVLPIRTHSENMTNPERV